MLRLRGYLDVLDDGPEGDGPLGPGRQQLHGRLKVLHVLPVHLQERGQLLEDVSQAGVHMPGHRPHYPSIILSLLCYSSIILSLLYHHSIILSLLYHPSIILSLLYHPSIILSLLPPSIILSLLYPHSIILSQYTEL